MQENTLRALAELRGLIETEIPQRLHSDLSPEATYPHKVGMPFTRQFRRYLSHPEQWGNTRLGMASILEVGAWCWNRHPSHREADGGALCGLLLHRVAYWGHDCPPELERMLRAALRHASDWRAGKLRTRLPEPLPYEKLPSAPRRAKVRRNGHRRPRRKGTSAVPMGRRDR